MAIVACSDGELEAQGVCGAIGISVGYALGTPLGIWQTGEWIGWDGSMLATIAGSILGAVIIGAIAVPLAHADSRAEPALWAVFLLGVPTAGAAGYQLFADWPTASGALAVPKSTTFTVIDLKF